MQSVIEERSYCPLIAKMSVIFSVLSNSFVINRSNFMKRILNINDHSVAILVKFHKFGIRYKGVIAL